MKILAVEFQDDKTGRALIQRSAYLKKKNWVSIFKTKGGRWVTLGSLKDVHAKVSGFITAEIEKQFKLMGNDDGRQN